MRVVIGSVEASLITGLLWDGNMKKSALAVQTSPFIFPCNLKWGPRRFVKVLWIRHRTLLLLDAKWQHSCPDCRHRSAIFKQARKTQRASLLIRLISLLLLSFIFWKHEKDEWKASKYFGKKKKRKRGRTAGPSALTLLAEEFSRFEKKQPASGLTEDGVTR